VGIARKPLSITPWIIASSTAMPATLRLVRSRSSVFASRSAIIYSYLWWVAEIHVTRVVVTMLVPLLQRIWKGANGRRRMASDSSFFEFFVGFRYPEIDHREHPLVPVANPPPAESPLCHVRPNHSTLPLAPRHFRR